METDCFEVVLEMSHNGLYENLYGKPDSKIGKGRRKKLTGVGKNFLENDFDEIKIRNECPMDQN